MKKLILAVMLSVLLLGAGSAIAATAALDNVPGGAGVIYWQAGNTFETFVDIQSITTVFNTTVHVTIYDWDSNDRIDFRLGLTPEDHVGFVISETATPGQCQVVAYSDSMQPVWGSGLPPAPTPQPFNCPEDASGLSYGYITLVHDNLTVPPVDPTLVSRTRTNYIAGDFFIMRAAILTPTNAIGANAQMLQGFANMVTPPAPNIVGLTETNVPGFEQFVNTNGPDALCTAVPVNWSNEPGVAFTTLDDAGDGPDIDSWELYSTDNRFLLAPRALLIADGVAPGAAACNRNGRHRALGSENGLYWGRFNTSGGLSSTLIMVFPASQGAALGTADPRGPGSVNIHAYDDDENWVSTGIEPQEVQLSVAGGPLLTDFNIPAISDAGEVWIETFTPMYGWVYTESATIADVYPLVAEQKTIVHTNLGDALGLGGPMLDPGVVGQSNVLLIP